MHRIVRVVLSLGLLVPLTAGASELESVSLGKLAVAPDAFDGKVLRTDASFMMVVAQKALSQCKKKETALIVTPPIVDGQMGAMGTVQYQACVSVDSALALADSTSGTVVSVSGTVRVVRQMGILTAIVFDGAEVQIQAPASPDAP